jgi:DNA-binding CsgD family transcriptional regulator
MVQVNQLSKREKEVVNLLLQGKSNKQIASFLNISVRTVEFHLKNVYIKHQVSSRIELILKLGNTTGSAIAEKLGDSTVDKLMKNTENRDRHNSPMDWATSSRDTLSSISEELEMKKQDIIAFVFGIICFSAAMGLRDIIPSIAVRAIIAALAFVILGLTIYRVRKNKRNFAQ